ncbi:hypothetical protein HPP92_007182 [Vanilla planifolia]|uniref:Uncharacterized protein n=1 Tax=Vanilla planifolia TaxID=51239 RepID=A0A835RFV8_VANPL|nr:hypothetical protein HPP92_007182 [Vanilla planifolia]
MIRKPKSDQIEEFAPPRQTEITASTHLLEVKNHTPVQKFPRGVEGYVFVVLESQLVPGAQFTRVDQSRALPPLLQSRTGPDSTEFNSIDRDLGIGQ